MTSVVHNLDYDQSFEDETLTSFNLVTRMSFGLSSVSYGRRGCTFSEILDFPGWRISHTLVKSCIGGSVTGGLFLAEGRLSTACRGRAKDPVSTC